MELKARSRSPSILNLGAASDDSGLDSRQQKLKSFRERYPVDDRAFDFLQKAPEQVQNLVLADFKPKSEGQKDYSALLTIFVRKVQSRWQGGGDGRHRKDADTAVGGRDTQRRRPRSRRRRDSPHGHFSDDGALSELGFGSGSSFGSQSLLGSFSDYSCSDRSSSCSSTSSSVTADSAIADEAKRQAYTKKDKILEDASAEEQRRVEQAEEDAENDAATELRRGREAIEDDFDRKLAIYRESLLQEKAEKVNQLKARVEMNRVDYIKRECDAARAERERQEKRAHTLVEETAQSIMAEKRRDRNNSRLQKELKRMEEKKAKEEKKRKPKKPSDRKRAKEKDGRKREGRPHRRRRHRGERGERGERGSSRSRRHHHRSKGDRDRRRDRGEDGQGRERRGHSDMESFRDRYPMDSRAFSILTGATPDVQRTVLTRFKPRSEGDSDYSALVMAFLRSVQLRMSGSGSTSRAVWRDARRGEGSQDRSVERAGSVDGFRRNDEHGREDGGREEARRSNSRSRSRSPGRDKALKSFRSRYPMDDRAYSNLEQASHSVQDVVISDFKPRREGEDDYSALVMAFVRAVQARATSRR
mmetsp:Transcript_36310/g.83470  ORF Transcript_36310/g.83470 Transcript_36310/m.83470 type:complete len:588 (-) Transcript_36310:37-1800(-)